MGLVGELKSKGCCYKDSVQPKDFLGKAGSQGYM